MTIRGRGAATQAGDIAAAQLVTQLRKCCNTQPLAARGRGLHTCPQAAFAPYHREIRPILGIPEEEIVVCGMALGHEDSSKPENQLRTDREPVEAFATFLK